MGEAMRILMLSAEYPPHHKGGQGIQCRELARELVRVERMQGPSLSI